MANYDLRGLRAAMVKAAAPDVNSGWRGSLVQDRLDNIDPYVTSGPMFGNGMSRLQGEGAMTAGEWDVLHRNWNRFMNPKTAQDVEDRRIALNRIKASQGEFKPLTYEDLPGSVQRDVDRAYMPRGPRGNAWQLNGKSKEDYVKELTGKYNTNYGQRRDWLTKSLVEKETGKPYDADAFYGRKQQTPAAAPAPAAPAPAPAPQTPVQDPIAPQPESVSDVTTVKPTTPAGNGSLTMGGQVDLTPKTPDVGSMTFPAPTTPAAPSAAAPAPAPAPATPAPAPAQEKPKTPTMQDLRGISRQQMMQNRKWTAARNMNSEMDRWKTWMAMNGNRNASNADYWAWKKQQGVQA